MEIFENVFITESISGSNNSWSCLGPLKLLIQVRKMFCHPFPPILSWPVPVTGDELHGGRPYAFHAFGVQLIRSGVPYFRIATTLLSTFLSNDLFKPIIIVPHFQISPSQRDFNHHNNEVRNLFQLCIYDDTTSSASDCKEWTYTHSAKINLLLGCILIQ